MNPQQPIWIQRNGKASGPHPLAQVVNARKIGKLLPADRFGTSATGPWTDWPAFVAEIKAGSPSHIPQDNQPATTHSQGIYRVTHNIILVNRKSATFPYRCIISGNTSGLMSQPITIQTPNSAALLTESEKTMTPMKWVKRVIGFAIEQVPGLSDAMDVIGKAVDFGNAFGFGKTTVVDVFVDEEAYKKWTQRNRRASKWLLICIALAVCSAGIAALLTSISAPVSLQVPFFILSITGFVFGIPSCIALRMVMGNRRLLEMQCFNDEWLWLDCREKAFVESLGPSPLQTPVYRRFFTKWELPARS